LIVASISVVTKQHTTAVSIQRRRWKSFDFDLFAGDLEQSRLVIDPPSDVADLFECYDETLRQPVDKHAPLHQVKVRSRPSAPWFDAECCSTKATTRKLEKAYRRIRSKQTEDAWRAHFQKQRVPFQQKFIGHWSTIIDSCQGDAKSLWSKLKFLLEPNTRVVSSLSACDLARYFAAQIDTIRASTIQTSLPNIERRDVPENLSDLQPATANEFSSRSVEFPSQAVSARPAPTWLIKRAVHILGPVIARMCNASFQQEKLPTACKKAIVRPLLKKLNLDPIDPASYRPVSNLSFLSKVVEKNVDARLSEYVCRHRLLPAVQSACRPYHSTETAVVRVLNDMIAVLGQGHVGVLVLLDMSAAFDTVDHTILLDVERGRFGIRDKPLHRLSNFLSERKQIARFNSLDSDDIALLCGVPQRSVLGPKRFTEYAEDVST
jgi:hypothetical protein